MQVSLVPSSVNQVLTDIDHEEEVLQNLAATTSKQKLQLQQLEEASKDGKEHLAVLANKIDKLQEVKHACFGVLWYTTCSCLIHACYPSSFVGKYVHPI